MQRLTRNRAGATHACLGAAAGCEADPEPPPRSHHARDSAGIAIAVNSGAPAGAERWSVDAEPMVSIGGADGPPATMFTVVTGATRLTDGTIVVLENETSELRFFDPGGAHLRTAGGFGEGPGEFEYAESLVRLAGVTLLVDAGDRHLRFSPVGDYVRQTMTRAPQEATRSRPRGSFAWRPTGRKPFSDTTGMTGVAGDVWVRRGPFVPTLDETVFDVFDGQGRFRGEVRLEGYFWLYEVGDDYVLGSRLDELGIAHVQLRRLSRAGAVDQRDPGQ